jgi:hypothetical protein
MSVNIATYVLHDSKTFLQFYFVMFLLYAAIAGVWGWMCYQNMQDLLPIQVSIILLLMC